METIPLKVYAIYGVMEFQVYQGIYSTSHKKTNSSWLLGKLIKVYTYQKHKNQVALVLNIIVLPF